MRPLRVKSIYFALVMAAIMSSNADAQTYPITLDNCGHELTFEKAPTSSVTIGQAATEAMYLLGLADTVKGTAVWFKMFCRNTQT